MRVVEKNEKIRGEMRWVRKRGEKTKDKRSVGECPFTFLSHQ